MTEDNLAEGTLQTFSTVKPQGLILHPVQEVTPPGKPRVRSGSACPGGNASLPAGWEEHSGKLQHRAFCFVSGDNSALKLVHTVRSAPLLVLLK